jgi:tRNA(Leu) C34 or U34 (ribose-2'-O)-methylase TrmL
VSASGAGRHHGQDPTRPGSCGVDGLAGTGVRGVLVVEEVQDVVCAVGGPQGEEPVVLVGEFSTAADRDQPRVSGRREDHTIRVPVPAVRSTNLSARVGVICGTVATVGRVRR